jgi:hypothetical protein
MSLSSSARIEPGQTWTGRSGFGPNIVIESIDLETGKVRTRRVPTDAEHPYYDTNLTALCENFRPK